MALVARHIDIPTSAWNLLLATFKGNDGQFWQGRQGSVTAVQQIEQAGKTIMLDKP